jgi:cysteine desulfurase
MFGFGTQKKERIYLDHASATPILAEASRAVQAAEKFVGNPGAIHAEGVEAARALESARASIASVLGVKSREVLFASGLTEANNLAIVGFARALERIRRTLAGTHWIVSSIEHASVLECFAEIERLGASVTHIDPDSRGIILPETLRSALTAETVFVSIGWANNEIGVIQQLSKIAQIIRAHELAHKTAVAFHSDAGQGPLYLPTSIHSLGVDLLSISASKLYGPHGIGALYVNNRIQLAPIILGGSQERGLRAGTENVALAAGFAAAFDVVAGEREKEGKRLQKMRDDFAKEVLARIPGAILNGELKHSLPHMLNISIPDINAEYLALSLDHAGVAISTKSACNEGEKASHVVEALAGEPWRAENTLRFSLGRSTTAKELRRAAEILFTQVHRI